MPYSRGRFPALISRRPGTPQSVLIEGVGCRPGSVGGGIDIASVITVVTSAIRLVLSPSQRRCRLGTEWATGVGQMRRCLRVGNGRVDSTARCYRQHKLPFHWQFLYDEKVVIKAAKCPVYVRKIIKSSFFTRYIWRIDLRHR